MFNRLFWASIVLGLLYLAYAWATLFEGTEDLGEMGPFFGGVVIFSLVIGYGISFLLWFLIWEKASNVARWIYAVLTGLGAALGVLGLSELPWEEIAASFVMTAVQIAGVVFLYLPDAAEWFETGGGPSANDASTFE